MYKKIVEYLKNKNIAIIGYGREGKSSYHFIRKYLPNQPLTILDGNVHLIDENSELKQDINTQVIVGEKYLEGLENYDLLMKSPGITFKNLDLSQIEDKIISQLSLILDFFKDNIIGITATKGKSTTTTLIAQVLKDQGYDAYLLGNIGIPIFDYVDKFTDKSILVIEMAAFQLEFVKSSPHISLLLNLFEEHFDFFRTKEAYFQSKMNIFKYQNNNDFGLYTSENETLNQHVLEGHYLSNLIDVNKEMRLQDGYVYFHEKKLYNINDKRFLLGEHNLKNILFVLRLSELLSLDLAQTIKTINAFKGLEHRMEFVGVYDNVKYYNDSIATIPEATINCIEALKDVDTIIFGGMDRGIDYHSLIQYFNNSDIDNFICMKDTGYKIGKQITKGNVYFVESLEEAVNIAKKVTKKICVMSPAAPSYNEFKNFEEKGRKYKDLIKRT